MGRLLTKAKISSITGNYFFDTQGVLLKDTDLTAILEAQRDLTASLVAREIKEEIEGGQSNSMGGTHWLIEKELWQSFWEKYLGKEITACQK